MKKSFLVHAVKKMGAAAAGSMGQDLRVGVNKVFHPDTPACRQHGLCGTQRAKKLRVTRNNECLAATVKIPAQRWPVSALIAAQGSGQVLVSQSHPWGQLWDKIQTWGVMGPA